jgi:hypothetical protein
VRIGLGINRDYVTKAKADGIAVLLTDVQAQTAVSWQLDIFASTEVGEFMVGTLYTVPAAVGAVGTLAPNRLIGHAYCPGARAWKIRATGPSPTGGAGPTVAQNISAELKAAPARCCFGQATGVFYAQGRVILNGGALTAPLTAVRNDWIAPVLLQTVTMYNPGTNGVELWGMAFDLGAGPGPGAGSQPTRGLSIDLPQGATGQINLNPPILFQNGLWLVISTTPDTYTPPGAGTDQCRMISAVVV